MKNVINARNAPTNDSERPKQQKRSVRGVSSIVPALIGSMLTKHEQERQRRFLTLMQTAHARLGQLHRLLCMYFMMQGQQKMNG